MKDVNIASGRVSVIIPAGPPQAPIITIMKGGEVMGEQRNLTEENVEELRKHLEKMQQKNPDLTYRFFPQDEPPQADRRLVSNNEILEKLESIERQLKMIFDGHVLIDGVFQKLNLMGKQL